MQRGWSAHWPSAGGHTTLSNDTMAKYKGRVVLTEGSLRFRSNKCLLLLHYLHHSHHAYHRKRGGRITVQIDSIAKISREPSPPFSRSPEQFLTLNVPGKVLTSKVRGIVSVRYRHSPSQSAPRTLATAGTRTTPPEKSYPPSVQLNVAILCDDTPTLGYTAWSNRSIRLRQLRRGAQQTLSDRLFFTPEMHSIAGPSKAGSTVGIPETLAI